MNLRDYELEGEICRVLREYRATGNRILKRLLWEQYRRLRGRRSPQMVDWINQQAK